MHYKVSTAQEYIDALPEDRKVAIQKLRKVILENLPPGLSEEISYRMIGYVVPHALYPAGYHCDPNLPLPFMNIASQKNFIALYHMGLYAKKELLDWLVGEYPKYVKNKLDMGKSCIRFKKPEQIPFQLIGELAGNMTAKEWIGIYERKIKKMKR